MSGAGAVVRVDGGCRSTSLRERDCLARAEPRRREECRSTRALSLRATFLLQGGKVGEDGGGMRRYRDRREARRNWNRKKKVGKRKDRWMGGK